MKPPSEAPMMRAARWLAFASAVTILVSIAASQILLALALVALLLSGAELRLPRIWPLLALFIAGTVIALLVSDHPAEGLPQIRKLFVFLELLVVFSAIRQARMVRWLFLCWAGVAAINALRGMVQFAQKIQEAHRAGLDFYEYYVGERITGFMSHWNTYAAQEMFALLMLAAFLFFAPPMRRSWVAILCAALAALAVLLGETRAVWIGTAAAALYLVWFWRGWVVLALPAIVAAAYLVSPPAMQERFTSLIQPKQVDSNEFRIVTWRTGIRMIEAHPWFGLGPEGPKYHFADWVPPDIPRPLPEGFYGHLHNIYLQYAAERGVPTLLVLLVMIGKILIDFSRGVRTLSSGRSHRRFILHGAIAIVVAATAEGFFEYNLGDSEILTMFLIVIACGYQALEEKFEG